MSTPIIVWLRQDLRLHDNPALHAAMETGHPVLPLYIYDAPPPNNQQNAPDYEMRPGGASRWWLHHSLSALAKDLNKLGGQLVLKRGAAKEVLTELVNSTQACGIYWNRCYEPFAVNRDKAIKQELQKAGLDMRSFNGALLIEPWELKTLKGEPYRVFTPFWRAARKSLAPSQPLPAPTKRKISFYDLSLLKNKFDRAPLEEWALLPSAPDWAGGLRESWTPGERGAKELLDQFLSHRLAHYSDGRDRPDKEFTSRLSPHLHWGEVSPRQIWAALDHASLAAQEASDQNASDQNIEKFLSEIGWREFSTQLLFHAPEMVHRNLRAEFDAFPWQPDENLLTAWQNGQTGYPIVDAGMRQLWTTGWMHNRVRMIVASVLVKHFLQPWQAGAKWFWDTLVDADLANNTASWQWVAGCGADAAPYYRVFNPVLQGEKFDPNGDYVRRWVPELASVTQKYIHAPWKLDTPPQHYPAPKVALESGRARALEAYKALKDQAEPDQTK